jgi:hypothetical protein
VNWAYATWSKAASVKPGPRRAQIMARERSSLCAARLRPLREKSGAGDQDRTDDIQLGKLVLAGRRTCTKSYLAFN